MQREKLRPYLKWITYYLLLVILYSLQTTPRLFELYGIKPVLVVPLVVCVCMFEPIMPSMVFSVFAGLLWDISSDKLFGFNAIIFIVCGVLISLLCIFYLHTKLMNSLLFCTVTMIVQGLLSYTFYFAVWGHENAYIVLLSSILPTIVYTALSVIPIYFLVRYLSNKFNTVVRL